MDSLTQLALGAAVGVAAMGRRTAAWKAALWGGVAGTLPDLDVVVTYAEPVLTMVRHRAESHAPFWQTLVSLPLAQAVARLHRETDRWRRWWLALWLALVTHPLLDALTVYGTQLALPFSDYPYGVGSVFIIDPLVTLPWVVGVAWALASRGQARGRRANRIGLTIGCAVLAAGVVLQARIERDARASLAAQGIAVERLLVTPAAFTMLLWRVVAVAGDDFHEGYRSLLDAPGPIRFTRYDRGAEHEAAVAGSDAAQRLRRFSHGFYKLSTDTEGRVVISDLRMGYEPHYVFAFAVAEPAPDHAPIVPSVAVGGRSGDTGEALRWLVQRVRGKVDTPPPR